MDIEEAVADDGHSQSQPQRTITGNHRDRALDAGDRGFHTAEAGPQTSAQSQREGAGERNSASQDSINVWSHQLLHLPTLFLLSSPEWLKQNIE